MCSVLFVVIGGGPKVCAHFLAVPMWSVFCTPVVLLFCIHIINRLCLYVFRRRMSSLLQIQLQSWESIPERSSQSFPATSYHKRVRVRLKNRNLILRAHTHTHRAALIFRQHPPLAPCKRPPRVLLHTSVTKYFFYASSLLRTVPSIDPQIAASCLHGSYALDGDAQV